MKVAVNGCTGRLGRAIVEELLRDPAATLVGAFTHAKSTSMGESVGGGIAVTPLLEGALRVVDVVIDAGLPAGLQMLLELDSTIPVVSGATGCRAELLDLIESASTKRAILHASNFTAGIALLQELAKTAVAALPEYEVEVVESHHNKKRDAPSGTALTLAEAVTSGRGEEVSRVPIHSLRMGDVIGEHTVWIGGPGERISLGHIASSRQAFALGAVRAGFYLVDKSVGRYTMRDVLFPR